jgi:hypothetical protein
MQTYRQHKQEAVRRSERTIVSTGDREMGHIYLADEFSLHVNVDKDFYKITTHRSKDGHRYWKFFTYDAPDYKWSNHKHGNYKTLAALCRELSIDLEDVVELAYALRNSGVSQYSITSHCGGQ